MLPYVKALLQMLFIPEKINIRHCYIWHSWPAAEWPGLHFVAGSRMCKAPIATMPFSNAWLCTPWPAAECARPASKEARRAALEQRKG